uniref:Ribonuclease A-domain domain-containing protein n=1 Tax=Oryzias latipes TaxID=8090 RepID=H2LPS5_ORYLA
MKIQVISVLLLLSAEHIFGHNFFEKHVVKEWNGNCDEKMKAINEPLHKCKDKNTFIVDPSHSLHEICDGKKDQEPATSKDPFVTHLCELKDNNFPVCTYTETGGKSIKIDVVCGQKIEPVHYGKPYSKKTSGKKKN